MNPSFRNAGIVLIGLAVTIILACLLAAIVGCEPVESPEKKPLYNDVFTVENGALKYVSSYEDYVKNANVPPEDRQGNWGPSCGWAAMCIVLQEHGLPKTAEAFRGYYRGATCQGTIESAARECGLGFAGTTDGDMDFLRWCNETNRKASVTWKVRSGRSWGGHRVVFYGFHEGRAYFVDVNSPQVMRSTPIDDFQRWWRWSGGDACTAYAYGSQPPEPCKWEKFRGRDTSETNRGPAATKAAGDRIGPGGDRVAAVVRRDGPLKRLVQRLRRHRATRARR